MRERGTRYPRIKRNWQVVGSNLHTSQPKLFLHAAARSFSIYYRGNESRELLDFCPTPPMKFTPACFHPASSFSFQSAKNSPILDYDPEILRWTTGCVTFCFEWFCCFFLLFTRRGNVRDMAKFDFYSLPRLSLTASEISSFLRGMRNIDEFE